MMVLYWFYDLPPFLSFILITGFFPAFGVLGLHISRKTFHKKLSYGQDRNDQVAFYMSVLGVFYGITLGLVAVGTWENFETVQDKVAVEASTLGALYRDVSALPEPIKSKLQNTLKDYTNKVIHEDWPLQQRAIVSKSSLKSLNEFQQILYTFRPAHITEEISLNEIVGKFNELVMLRRLRMMTIGNGLPNAVWIVTIIGALACISFFWFLLMEEYWIQVVLTFTASFFIGTMIFLIVMMDNPYTGEIAVPTDSFDLVQEELMK